MAKRKSEVCGTNDFGDIHIFCSDNGARAEEVADVMREDLEAVELTENPCGGSLQCRLLAGFQQTSGRHPA